MKRCLLLAHGPDPMRFALMDWLLATMDVRMVTWALEKPIPCDLLISYRYHWVVPKACLPALAINFHPGPPEYPGIGSTDWALHDGARHFGVTAHHMAPLVDSGPIIAVRRFPMRPGETLATLTQRSHAHLLALADEVLTEVILGTPLPVSKETWVGKPRTRKQLDALMGRFAT